MTKHEAHEIMKQVIRTVRDKTVYEAMQISMKALSWECAHEKMLGIIVPDTRESEQSNEIKENINEN